MDKRVSVKENNMDKVIKTAEDLIHSHDYTMGEDLKVSSVLLSCLVGELKRIRSDEHNCQCDCKNESCTPSPTHMRGGNFTLQDIKDVCEPVKEFLHEHGNPHSTITITQTHAKLVSVECSIPFDLRD